MKKDKTNLKIIIAVIVSVIISSSITAFAAIKISATEIGYNNTTVADELDSIYRTMFSNNYSFGEKQIGKWVDDKPLYQKTIDTGVLPNATSKIVATGINDLGNVVDFKGVFWRPSDGATFTLPRSRGDALNANIDLAIVGNNIYINTFADFSDFTKSYVTIQYTKTNAQPIAD